MEIQICKCGNNIQLDYSNAATVSLTPSKSAYQWKCTACGQTYYKEVPEAIKIDEKTI